MKIVKIQVKQSREGQGGERRGISKGIRERDHKGRSRKRAVVEKT